MITYPVDVQNSRFTFKLGGVVKRRQVWPRADGGPIQNADAALVILEESQAPLPTYDPATHKLDAGRWVDDEANQTAAWAYVAIALSADELAALATQADLATKRTNLAAAIATLRSWADQAAATTVTSGNAVAVLQTTVTRLGVFFDHFADLLEVQRIR